MKILASHVRMEVDNLEQTMEYLSKTLGLVPLRQLRKPPANVVVWYPGLEIAQSSQQTDPSQISHLAWEVDDIQEAMRAMKSNGVTFDTEEPQRIDPSYLDSKEVVQYAFFRTPLGFRGELCQINARQDP